MVTEDQSAVVAFLEAPSTHGGASVERVDTHASIVFLAGRGAWKLKRAVRYDYLDFSTVEARRAMCEAELRVNRRTAPSLYRRVVPVTRERDGGLAMGGHGQPVDWVLEMARFDQELLFDRLADRGGLGQEVMTPLAHAVARFHETAERRHDHGGRDALLRVVQGNAAGFAEQGREALDTEACRRVLELSLAMVDRHGRLLDERRSGGFVRQCHGDLHLRNIVLLDGAPTLFDAIEFNDDLSAIDVAYDLAFLLMDLWHRGLTRHANTVLNGYLAATGDDGALPPLPVFLSCRAAIRAKTSVTAASLASGGDALAALHRRARQYLALAEALLQPPSPRLVAIGGASGSGKSTLALAAAPTEGPVPGAVVLRSDEVRKSLYGVAASTRLDPAAYAPEVSRRVYETLTERAAAVVRRGHSAIVDAVFLDPSGRQMVEAVATAAGVPFVGLWLDAPSALLLNRVAARREDASDADASVVMRQLAQDVAPHDWHRIDAAGSVEDTMRRAVQLLGSGGRSSLDPGIEDA